jgi:hypothetical protein
MSAPAAPPDSCAPEVAQVMGDLFVWHLRGVTIQMVEPVDILDPASRHSGPCESIFWARRAVGFGVPLVR